MIPNFGKLSLQRLDVQFEQRQSHHHLSMNQPWAVSRWSTAKDKDCEAASLKDKPTQNHQKSGYSISHFVDYCLQMTVRGRC